VSEPGTPRLVVIVEDDAAIAEGLALNLKLQGYRAEIAGDAETAVEVIAAARPALVLLDISLPKRSGLWVLETLRDGGDPVPVIVLSARQDEFDKVAALCLGADDYVTKPFALAELLARVGAVLRRAPPDRPPPAQPPPAPSSLQFGDVVVDLSARTVTKAGKPIKLTHLEFELLAFFCCNDERVFSREELLREVWGLRQATPARTVDNFVAQLRAKLEDDPDRPVYLLTVRGSGYRFARGAR
jgi:two-component system, OmpR family, alkaline phosphatase synthesis response regulator PhoP